MTTESLVGKTVSHYKITRSLGAGGFALNHPGICTVHAIEQHERQPPILG